MKYLPIYLEVLNEHIIIIITRDYYNIIHALLLLLFFRKIIFAAYVLRKPPTIPTWSNLCSFQTIYRVWVLRLLIDETLKRSKTSTYIPYTFHYVLFSFIRPKNQTKYYVERRNSFFCILFFFYSITFLVMWGEKCKKKKNTHSLTYLHLNTYYCEVLFKNSIRYKLYFFRS